MSTTPTTLEALPATDPPTTPNESHYQLTEWRTFYNPITLTLCLTMPAFLLFVRPRGSSTSPATRLARYKPLAAGLLALGIEGQLHYRTGHGALYWAGYPARAAAQRRKAREELPGELARAMEEEVRREDEERRAAMLREVVEERERQLRLEVDSLKEKEREKQRKGRWDFFWNRERLAKGVDMESEVKREG
jgi:hypothetical protein